MNMTNRIALVGAGGVGKSTLLRLFEKRGYAIFPSISRDYYAMQGIKDESEYMRMTPSAKAAFQHGMRDYYKASYINFVEKHPDRNIATDRSLFDHLAFGIYGLEGLHTTVSVQDLIDDSTTFANVAYSHLIYIPYPQPWMGSISIEDGFRNTDAAKNYCIASLQYHALHIEKAFDRLRCHILILDRSNRSPPEVFSSIQQLLGDESLQRVMGEA